MAWIIVEGIDRSGKSSVANMYKERGYEVHHMSAPDKKFSKSGYTGPSYLDECLETYMHFDGKDVIFDRSIYGETIWPDVYGRKSQLSSEDIEVLKELEDNNNTEYIFMSDPDFDAHWQRCVDSKEPLNRDQFNIAVVLYEKMEKRFTFQKRQLSDYNEDMKKTENKNVDQSDSNRKNPVSIEEVSVSEQKSIHQLKLDEANAISAVLSSKIIKRKGANYDSIEKSIREHLQDRLSGIFNSKAVNKLSDDEIFILKKYADRLKQTLENKK